LLSPAADQLKKREPGIGETLDNSHYAFEKRSLAGKNPPTRAVKLHANFMKILRALNAEVVASLSIGCRYIVAWWVGAGGSPNQDADVTGLAEGNMITSDSASSRSVLRSSIKVEVKKKHTSCGWNFSCFAAHLMERDLFLPAAP